MADPTLSPKVERARQEWYTTSGRLVVGYSCGPSHPGMWFVPEEGGTLTEGFHIFRTQREGLERGLASAYRALADAQDVVHRLSRELARLS